MGRLFDAGASFAGIRQQVNYEAQAAIELETIGDPDETGSYELELHTEDQVIQIDPTHLIRNIVQELHDGASLGQISTRFHNSVVKMVLEICLQLKKDFGINKIALSGGVWQNMTLFRKTVQLLVKNSFNVYYHRLVPPNDGGLALGQAVVAARRLECA
jgi:hydrogenase maturation protein HypF